VQELFFSAVAFSAVAVGVFICSSALVGLRLLHLHRRTRGGPELLLGLMLLIMGGVGYPTAIASRFAGPAVARWLIIATTLCTASGGALFFLFTWHVFRRQELWARCLAGAGVVASCAHAGWRSRYFLSSTAVSYNDHALGALVLTMIPTLWAAYESLRNYWMMRRRLRVGLGDVVVCNRFMLFGLVALSSSAALLITIVALWMQVDLLNSAGLQLASSFIGLLEAGTLLLTFAPPRFYLDWVRERSRAHAMGALSHG